MSSPIDKFAKIGNQLSPDVLEGWLCAAYGLDCLQDWLLTCLTTTTNLTTLITTTTAAAAAATTTTTTTRLLFAKFPQFF